MKIVVGGQIDKQKVYDTIKGVVGDRASVEIKDDIAAAMAVKTGQADYYFGACKTGGGGALGRESGVGLQLAEQLVGVPGRDALHRPAAAIAGQLVVGQRAGKAHPHRPVAARDAFQHSRREGQVMGILRQGQCFSQGFAAAGRACGGVALGEGGFALGKGHSQHRGHAEQVHAVLAGVQVGQQKAGLLAGHAQQHGELVVGLRQPDGDAALTAGGLSQLGAQLLAAQQHRAAHQRHQHQKGRQQRRPERVPAPALVPFVHETSLPFRWGVLTGMEGNMQFSGQWAGSFSEDCPLGWDPVARRAIGRAMEWPDSCPRRKLPARWPYYAAVKSHTKIKFTLWHNR